MTTYRERREARADRLRGWAAKRQTDAAAVFKAGEPYTGDTAFNTQPGRIPFRARLIAREDRAHESVQKAAGMERRADGIEAQLARSIYDDDPDAIDALRERLAVLEAERGRYKAFNASARRGAPDYALLDARQRAELASLIHIGSAFVGRGGGFPKYILANLSGNIGRNRERLERLERLAAQS